MHLRSGIRNSGGFSRWHLQFPIKECNFQSWLEIWEREYTCSNWHSDRRAVPLTEDCVCQPAWTNTHRCARLLVRGWRESGEQVGHSPEWPELSPEGDSVINLYNVANLGEVPHGEIQGATGHCAGETNLVGEEGVAKGLFEGMTCRLGSRR